jgi:hypothetical protein
MFHGDAIASKTTCFATSTLGRTPRTASSERLREAQAYPGKAVQLICRPTGKPALSTPQGIEIAGLQDALNSIVRLGSGGLASKSSGIVWMVGQTSRSHFSKNRLIKPRAKKPSLLLRLQVCP